MNLFLRTVFVLLLILGIPTASKAEDKAKLAMYDTEAVAKLHCHDDVVVWLNTPSGVFHFKDDHLYGKTKNGAFVCKQDALKNGNRPVKNVL